MPLIFQKAAASAVRGGAAGAIAMILQVVLLMWLRTVINYQYRNGGTISHAFSTLWAEGGILRFYQGAQYALLQGPLSRFGDTAANEGIKELLSHTSLSVGIITACASFTAALWRMFLTPVDTLKTTLQVSGSEGMQALWTKVHKYGILVLYDGALGNWGANLVGHYPWFVINNFLEKRLPAATSPRHKLMRRALIGFCSSVVSDCCSNSVRVVKTVKQTSELPLSYIEAVRQILESSGLSGLFLRGLGMKLVANALSSILFSVLWKMLMERFQKASSATKPASNEVAHDETMRKKANNEPASTLHPEVELQPLLSDDGSIEQPLMQDFVPDSPTMTKARRRMVVA